MAKNGKNTVFTRGQDSTLVCEARYGLNIESLAGRIVPQRIDSAEKQIIEMIDKERIRKSEPPKKALSVIGKEEKKFLELYYL